MDLVDAVNRTIEYIKDNITTGCQKIYLLEMRDTA
jgi:hypothetical protein